MLGNGSSERYKLSLVLQRRVAVRSGLVPPVNPCTGWSGNTGVYPRMLLGQGARSGLCRGSLGEGGSLPLWGTAGRVVYPQAVVATSIPQL